MAELKSNEVLAKPKFQTYKWNLYDTVNLKTQTIIRTLDEDGYRKTSSFEGESGYIYTYYISHIIPFTVDVFLSNNDLLNTGFANIIYAQIDSTYTATIQVSILESKINDNNIEFKIKWQQASQPKLPSTNLICLTGIFQIDNYNYHLIHPYHYNPQDQLLANIVLSATDNALQSSRDFTLDENGFIRDLTTRDAFLCSTNDNGNGMLEITFSKNKNFFNFIEIVYIT